MKINLDFIIGCCYVAFFTGMIAGVIGEPVKCSGEMWKWYAPLQVLTLLGLPFVFGFLAGRRSKYGD